jgi:hypothetical protein
MFVSLIRGEPERAPNTQESGSSVYLYIYIHIYINLYVILHSNDSMLILRQHVLTVIGKGRRQPSRRSCQNRSAAVVCLEQRVTYLDLEPWQWKSFTATMIIE